MELGVQKREKFGRLVKSLRDQGFIPAELYGKGVENLHLSVAVKDFNKVFKQAGENTMVDLIIDSATSKEKRPAEGEARPEKRPAEGEAPAVSEARSSERRLERRPVLIYDVQTDSLTDQIINVDFYQVRMDEKIKINVPLEFVGESPAVKNQGGILVKAVQEIGVEALPDKIPHSLKVDLSRITELNQSIALKDLEISPDVKVLMDLGSVVAIVKPPLTEEQEAKLAAEVKPEDIKVETEEKKVERAAEKAAAGEVQPAAGAALSSAKASEGKPASEKK